MHRLRAQPSLSAIAAAGLVLASANACRRDNVKPTAPQATTTHATVGSTAASVAIEVNTAMTPKLKGKRAPGFTLPALDGTTVSLDSFRGKPVLLNFWATWCGPCKVEMPWFQDFAARYKSSNLVVLGVAADDTSTAEIAKVVKKLGVTYPVLLKDSHVVSAYGGLEYLPETFYIDPRGNVLIETAGATASPDGRAEIQRNIKILLNN